MALFRANGFHAVSVEDLVQATGLNRFALYEKFGGKEGLFYETLDFYYEVSIREELLSPLFLNDVSIDSLLNMLRIVRATALDPEQRCGCLIVNANVELGGSDDRVAAAADAVMRSFQEATLNVLHVAAECGEISPEIPIAQRADYIVVMIQAFFSLAYISRDAADKLSLHLIREVEAWQLSGLPAVSSRSER